MGVEGAIARLRLGLCGKVSPAVLAGSPDNGRVVVLAPLQSESSMYAISTFETIDDDDEQYCDAEEPVEVNQRRWGRLFGCLRLGCAGGGGGLKSRDK